MKLSFYCIKCIICYVCVVKYFVESISIIPRVSFYLDNQVYSSNNINKHIQDNLDNNAVIYCNTIESNSYDESIMTGEEVGILNAGNNILLNENNDEERDISQHEQNDDKDNDTTIISSKSTLINVIFTFLPIFMMLFNSLAV